MGKQRTQKDPPRRARASRGRPRSRVDDGGGDDVTPPVAALDAPTAPEPATGDDLGPAVTAEFEEAVGLQDLVPEGRGRGGPREPTAPAPPHVSSPAPSTFDPAMFHAIIKSLDSVSSAFAGVEPETERELAEVEPMLKPLADHYAGGSNSVAMLWGLAILGLTTWGLRKYHKWTVAHPPKPKRPNVATAEQDDDEPVVTPINPHALPRDEFATPS